MKLILKIQVIVICSDQGIRVKPSKYQTLPRGYS